MTMTIKDITIKELKEEKKSLALKIGELVNKFHQDTGVEIKNIALTKYYADLSRITIQSNVDITLESL